MSTASATKVRTHWVVLGVTVVTLVVALLAHGYATRSVGASTQSTDLSEQIPAMAEVGPLLDLSGTGLRSVKVADKTIALTFDDGPDPRWTPKVLDILERRNVHATFFVVGTRVGEHPELVARAVADGDDIGAHTFTHADLTSIPAWQARLEMRLTQVAIVAATGRATRLVRPPYSSGPNAVRVDTLRAWDRVAQEGYWFVLSTQDTNDWKKTSTPVSITAAAIPDGNTGGVVLMHDGGGTRTNTIAALDQVITTLQAHGYTFVTVSELAGIPRDVVMPKASTTNRLQAKALPIVLGVGDFVTKAFTLMAIALAVLSVLRAIMLVGFAGRHARTRTDHDIEFTPTVSIVVPAYNESAGIEAAVTSLATSEYPQFEVIVVDDGSSDDTAAKAGALVAAKGWQHVRVITKANGGKPSALNAGLAIALGDIIVTVDGDTVFEPATLAALVQPFRDPVVGAVSGNTKVANRKGILGRWQHLEYVIGFNLDRRFQDIAGCMPTVPGAIGAFRRDALVGIGGVSDDTLAEDTDLTMAMHRAGWSVAYEPRALAWTEAPARLGDLWRQRFRWSYGTMQAVWKHKHAVVERGPAGRLGRVGLPYLVVFQVLTTLIAPAIDVFTIYGILFLNPWTMLAYWLAFNVLQFALAIYALHLDDEPLRAAWWLPLQQIVYRQLMYLVVIQSMSTALAGTRTGWHKLRRIGIGTARTG